MTIYTKDIIYAIAIIIIMAWTIYKETKEMRARSAGLAPNPLRCQEHGEGIAKLEERVKGVEDDVREIKELLKKK
jgi:hypothetical protein